MKMTARRERLKRRIASYEESMKNMGKGDGKKAFRSGYRKPGSLKK